MKRRTKTAGRTGRTAPRKPAHAKRKSVRAAENRRAGPDVEFHQQFELRTLELAEALEQLTATSDVLQAISASGGDLKRVFGVVLSNATHLCKAKFGVLHLCEGENFRTVALHNAPKDYAAAKKRDPMIRGVETGNALDVVRRTLAPVQVADVLEERAYTNTSAQSRTSFVSTSGVRSLLAVPMLAGGSLIGVIIIYRQEVRPFTDKQIELVTNFAAQAVIAIENTRLLNELRRRTDDLSESLERQTATSEVLKIISSSPGDLEPVFQAMLANVTRICEAKFGTLFRFDGELFHRVAGIGTPPEFIEYQRQRGPFRPGNTGDTLSRMYQEKAVVHVIDEQQHPTLSPPAKYGGARSTLAVPLLKDARLVGAFVIYRQEVRPFAEKQIELVQNFAAQAVIAIENTRLLNELRQRTDDLTEALEQQTATSEVLKVISSSPGDLEPVFEAMLENATRICQAKFGALVLSEGDAFRVGALHNAPSRFAEFMRRAPIRPGPNVPLGRTARTKQVIHVADIRAEQAYIERDPLAVAGAELGGYRTILTVPLLKESELIGAIAIFRQEVRPFTDKQIELVKNFAAQAVIAIENTRLLNELRESLQQQTATADVLKVISRSAFDLQSVLNALVESAAKLCEADSTAIARQNCDVYELAATYGHSVEVVSFMKARPFKVERGNVVGRVVLEGKAVHLEDVEADPEFTYKEAARIVGVRTMLGVPLLRREKVIGVIVLQRRRMEPFTARQIELVTTFADQAVIAIENVRLFEAEQTRSRELAEALEQQTATSEVLQVISSSPGAIEPVLQAMLKNAVRICEAKFGQMFLVSDGRVRQAASLGVPSALVEFNRGRGDFQPFAGGPMAVLLRTRQPVHTVDVSTDTPGHPLAEIGGARSIIAVPMLKQGDLIGAFAVYRQEVRPFTEKQIELVTNFAAQAVIAVENARLLSELRESLQQQTATADVLKVISRSIFDLQTVLDTLVESAAKLCEADMASMNRPKDGVYEMVASYGYDEAVVASMRGAVVPAGRDSATGRAAQERRVVHIHDVKADPEYKGPKRGSGYRTMLGVPLMREGTPIGVIVLGRRTVRPFTEKQIELVTTFADQAVIAIENVRLFDEVQARTRELSEALERQTATSEVLSVISSSPGELEPVFNAVLENATRICEAQVGNLFLLEGDNFRAVAVHGESGYADWFRRQPVAVMSENLGSPLDRVKRTKQVQHIPDLRQDQSYLGGHPRIVSLVETAGVRTHIVVPMLKDNELVGALVIYREEVRPFSDKQIALLTNFAQQAVIAIENTRLLKELRQRTDDLTESLEQQTATSEVLRVISSSSGNLQPVFDSVLKNATGICGAGFGMLWLYEGNGLRPVAMHGVPSVLAEERAYEGVLRFGPDIPLGRVMITRQLVHVADIREEPGYIKGFRPFVRLADVGGARTLLVVPMVKDDELVGAIAIYRQEVRPFNDKQLELVKNFAAQAVIAIENTRLLNELRQRTDDLSEALEQQTATSEVLKVISSSPGNLEPVFDNMLQNAVRICEARFGNLFLLEGDTARAVAVHGEAMYVDYWQREPFIALPENRGIPIDRVVQSKDVVHATDMRTDESYLAGNPRIVALVNTGGGRAFLAVPMIKDTTVIGVIAMYRQVVRPFTDKQIELVQNFAAQAVIAIENTRLLNELRESLQQQTATAEVLKVISRSTFDLQTVLDTLVESAARLCEADFAAIRRPKGEAYQHAAGYAMPQEMNEYMEGHPVEPGRGSVAGRVLLEGKPIHVADVQADPEYTMGEITRRTGARTHLGVPLLRGGNPIGVIILGRKEARPFNEKQIELASTFADQAVIAIENVRLFESVEARTRELAKSLEDLRTAQDRLVQTEKLASLGQLTAGIAHEIKNPLNFVNNFSAVSIELIDELRDALSSAHLDVKLRTEISEIADMLQGNLDKVVQHGKRADSIVKNMLLHSRQGSDEHRVVDINALVEESLNLAYHGARAERQGFNITLEKSFDPAAGEVDLFPQEITRVLLNLISNGFYAATMRKTEVSDGEYEPTLAAATKSLGDSVEIRIRDNGTGIPPEVKEKMFNPFFTTKPAGEGTGLGLSISHDIIVKQHGGSIEVDTQPGRFTEFRIVLPREGTSLNKSGGRVGSH